MNHTKDSSRPAPVREQPATLIPPLNKGLGPMEGALACGDVPALGWNLLREDLSLPTAVLYEDKLAHNAQWMQKFVAAYWTWALR